MEYIETEYTFVCMCIRISRHDKLLYKVYYGLTCTVVPTVALDTVTCTG